MAGELCELRWSDVEFETRLDPSNADTVARSREVSRIKPSLGYSAELMSLCNRQIVKDGRAPSSKAIGSQQR